MSQSQYFVTYVIVFTKDASHFFLRKWNQVDCENLPLRYELEKRLGAVCFKVILYTVQEPVLLSSVV